MTNLFCVSMLFVSDTNQDDDLIDSGPIELPLGNWHRAKGARMVPFAGYSMPVQYEGIIAEHTWTRAHAGLFDVSHMGQLVISGEGAEAALEVMLPADLAALKLGNIRYSLLLAEDGGILDDLMITRWPDSFQLIVNGATKWDDIGFLREHLPDDVTINHREEQALLALQGPSAVTALVSLGIEPAMPQIVPVEHLKFMQMGPYIWQGIELGISRSGYTGEDGFEISVPADQAARLADALCAHPEVKPIGLGARDSLRLEAGLPLYGHDLNDQIDPVEGDLSFAISKRRRLEGGYNGSERIARHLAQGASTKRVGFRVEGKMAVREGAPVFNGTEQIGTITSGCFAPSLAAPISMGYVATDFAAPGVSLEAEVRGKRIALTVTTMPFVPHRYHR